MVKGYNDKGERRKTAEQTRTETEKGIRRNELEVEVRK